MKVAHWGSNWNFTSEFTGTYIGLVMPWWSELVDEVVNVFTDFLWLFLVEKVSYSFHYYYFLQQWYIFLEPTVVYIFLGSWDVIHKVQVAHDKLHWNFDLYPGPRRCKFPGPARQIRILQLSCPALCSQLECFNYSLVQNLKHQFACESNLSLCISFH